MSHWTADITLKGNHVALVPLTKEHRSSLIKAASDGKLWELWFTSVPSEDTIDAFIQHALKEKLNGTQHAFAVIHLASGDIIGSTRFMNMSEEHRRLEIGHTWYAASHQRSAVNTECKLLLLQHAFEVLKCICVQFLTHAQNERSRAAIARLGAKQDGILRNHRILKDGSYRDTVVFSITEDEWPEVKSALTSRLEKDT